MFKWLKGKVNKKIATEMNGCITQNLNFVYMVEAKKFALKQDVDPEIFNKILEIKEKTEQIHNIKKPGDALSPEENDILLELNKYCRNIWTNYFKGNAFKFDKEFPTEESKVGSNITVF